MLFTLTFVAVAIPAAFVVGLAIGLTRANDERKALRTEIRALHRKLATQGVAHAAEPISGPLRRFSRLLPGRDGH